MKRFEYLVTTNDHPLTAAALNAHGLESWELVSEQFMVASGYHANYWRCVFKREAEDGFKPSGKGPY